MSNKLTLRKGDSADALVELITSNIQGLVHAGEMLCRMVVNNPNCIEDLCVSHPKIPRRVFSDLLRVGERSLSPELFAVSQPSLMRLRSLPYTAQRQVLDSEGLEVAVSHDTFEAVIIPLNELRGEQLKQVIATDGIRSLPAQREYLVQLAARKAAKASVSRPPCSKIPTWRVLTGRVEVTRPTALFLEDLEAMVKALRKQKQP